MASESLADMFVSFVVNLDELSSIPTIANDVFTSLVASATAASEEITNSFTSASEGFTAITEAASRAGMGIEEGIAPATESLATLPAAAEESASQSQSAFKGFSLGSLITNVGMGIFAFQNLANMAGNLASGLLQPAMNAENMQESFTNLTGSAQAASDELSKLDAFAAKTQFTTMDIDAAGAQLLGFGFKASSIIPDIQAVGDNLSAVGKGTPAEVQSVIDIFGKMSTQGKISAMDINELGTHGIKALADIAAGAGTSTEAISKMIKNGTLPANQAIADLTAGIEKNPIYAGGMAKQSGTLSGIMSTLSSDWDQFMATIMQPALPLLEQGLSKLTTLLTDPNFQKFAKTVGTDIVNGLTGFANGVAKLINDGQQMANFFKSNQTAMDALIAVLLVAGGVITGFILPPLIAMGVGLAITAAGAIATAAPFILLGIVVAAAIFGIIEAFQHWQQITAAVGGFFSMIWGHVTQFFQDDVAKPMQTIINDLGGAFGGLGHLVGGVWNDIMSGIKGAIDDVIRLINNFIGFVDSIQIHIPAIGVGPIHTPALDWNGLGIPKIPLLSTGGFVPAGGVAIAGDPGPYSELVFGGTSGASVLSHAQSMAAMAGGEVHVHNDNHIYFDGREVSNQVMVNVLNQMRSAGHPIGQVA